MLNPITHSFISIKAGIDDHLYYFPFLGLITRSLKHLPESFCKDEYIDHPPSTAEIQGFIFVITTHCNLRCKYCYSITQGTPASMSYDEPASILDRYLRPEARTLFVNFFGGEPTLEMATIKHTVEHLRHIKGKTIYLRITTNGLIDRENIDYLIDNGFSIVVSSDGPPDLQNSLPKRKIARRVEETIRRLEERDAPFRVRCTITSENLDSLPSAIHYWKSLGIEHVHIEPYNPAGSSAEELSLLPPIDKFLEVFKRALDIAEDVGIWIQTGTYMNLLIPSTYFCTGAAGKYRVFNPDGSITTCYRVQNGGHACKEFIVGNWKQWRGEKVKNLQWRRNNYILSHHSVKQMHACDECPARLVCGGGCLIRNLTHGGGITSPDPWICEVRRNLFEDAIKRTWRAVRAGRCPVVFGRFVFENKILNHPSMGNPTFESNVASDLESDGLFGIPSECDHVDIYKAIGLRRQAGILPAYLKVSRAECI